MYMGLEGSLKQSGLSEWNSFFHSFILLFEFWQYSVKVNRHFTRSLNRIILC